MRRRRLFHVRDRQHLWDSSSDDEEQQPRRPQRQQQQQTGHQADVGLIHLSDSPEPVMRDTISTSRMSISTQGESSQQEQQLEIGPPYVPYTLQRDIRRNSILPAFPSSFYNAQPALLLANVPSMSEQCRESGEKICL